MGNNGSSQGSDRSSSTVVITFAEAQERCSEEEWERYNRGFEKLTRMNKGRLKLRVFQTSIVPFLPGDLQTAMFDVFDHGRTGFLSKEEFLIGMALVSHGTTQEKLQLLFHMYDLGGTGKLSRRDLEPFVSLFTRNNKPLREKLLSPFNNVNYMEFEDFESFVESCADKRTGTSPAMFNWIFDLTSQIKKDEEKADEELSREFDSDLWARRDSISKLTSFTKREITELQKFWDTSVSTATSTALCDLDTFVNFFQDEIPKSMLQRMFKSFDTNRSGQINTRDFFVGLSACVRGTEEEKLQFAFRAYCKDFNRGIGVNELKEMLSSLWTMIDVTDEMQKTQSSGKLPTDDELKIRALHVRSSTINVHDPIESLVSSIFKHYDCDRDGLISFKEFKAWTDHNPTALDFVNRLSMVTSKYWLRPPTRDIERELVENALSEETENLKSTSKYYIMNNKWFQSWAKWAEFSWNSKHCQTGSGSENQETPKRGPARDSDADQEGLQQGPSGEPGPIDNSVLLADSPLVELKADLVLNEDFVVVPEQVWLYFTRWYGGGPPIPRLAKQWGKNSDLQIELYPLAFTIQSLPSPILDQKIIEVQISCTASLEELYEKAANKLRQSSDRIKLYRLDDKDETRAIGDDMGVKLWELDNIAYGDVIVVDVMGINGEFSKSKRKSLFRRKNRSYWNRQSSYYGRSSGFGGRDMRGAAQTAIVAGRCGLTNLGNTCFMAAALQALLHCPPVKTYFQKRLHLHEVKNTSPDGTRGALPVQLGDLIENMFSGDFRSLAPRRVKRVVCNYNPMFRGWQQHDSQEFLNYVLQAMNEDLNRVTKKQYTELPDSDYRNDQIVAKEWLDSYAKRNDSMITDLFQGQFKESTEWPCGRINNIFSAYQMVSLPLPEPTVKVTTITVCFNDPSRSPMRYSLKIRHNETSGSFKKVLSKMTGIEVKRMLFVETYKGALYIMPSLRVQTYQGRDNIYIFEIPVFETKEKVYSLADLEVGNKFDVLDDRENYCEAEIIDVWVPTHLRKKYPQRPEYENYTPKITHPRFYATRRGHDVREGRLFKIHYTRYSSRWDEWLSEFSPRFQPYQKYTSQKKNKFGDLKMPDDANIFQFTNRRLVPIEDFFFRKHEAKTYGFPTLSIFEPGTVTHMDLYKWAWSRFSKFTRGLEDQHPFVLKKVRKDGLSCSICGWDRGCNGCPIPMNNEPADVAFGQCFAIDWNEKFWMKYIEENALEDLGVIEHESVEQYDESSKKHIDISQCLRSFHEPEKIKDVYCSDCKHLTSAKKCIKLWSAPRVLILHLKRLMPGRKLHHFIEFPTELDIKPYITPRGPPEPRPRRPKSTNGAASDVTSPRGEDTEPPAHPVPTEAGAPLDPEPIVVQPSAAPANPNSPNAALTRPENDPPSAEPSSPSAGQPDAEEIRRIDSTSRATKPADTGGAEDNEPSDGSDGEDEKSDEDPLHGDDPIYSADGKILYDLFAVVDHLGGSHSGHYVCKAIAPDPKTKKKQWCLFNDGRVTNISVSDVCTRSAYMLFYLRRDADAGEEDGLDFLPPSVRQKKDKEVPNEQKVIVKGSRKISICGRCTIS